MCIRDSCRYLLILRSCFWCPLKCNSLFAAFVIHLRSGTLSTGFRFAIIRPYIKFKPISFNSHILFSFTLSPFVLRYSKSFSRAVSYTHLDVYKRQISDLIGVLYFVFPLYRMTITRPS